MFHCGFEWTSKELKKFEQQLSDSCCLSDWFMKATSDAEPWMFYMCPKFIDHCLRMLEQVTARIEDFNMDTYLDPFLATKSSTLLATSSPR